MERSRQWLKTFKDGMVKAVSEGRMDEAKEWARRYFDELMILVSVTGIDSKEDARMIVLFALSNKSE